MHYRYGNDAIVDLRTPRRVQSRRLLGALTFDVHAEMKSFHENPLRVWVRDVSLKCQNSTKSRFRKVLTSTFHLACVLVNSKTSSKRRHRICYIDRTLYYSHILKTKSYIYHAQKKHRYAIGSEKLSGTDRDMDLESFRECTFTDITSRSFE